MAISHLAIVNQKLVHASTLVSLVTSVDSRSSTSERLKYRALVDSAILQLELAYVFYLRELGENYRIKNLARINRASQLADALAGANKSPSEAQELVTLEQDQQSWLCQMLAAYAGLLRSPEPEKIKKAFPVEGMISVVDISETTETLPPPDIAQVTIWLTEFRALVIRQRDTSAEF
jgi:hypothetical protein